MPGKKTKGGNQKIVPIRQDLDLLEMIERYCEERDILYRDKANINEFYRRCAVRELVRSGSISLRQARKFMK